METVLIDTSILIGRMRREPAAFLASDRVHGASFVICDVVLAEILAGARNRTEYERHHAELTSNFHILPFTMEVSQRFREILKHFAPEHHVHLADHLIAATAMAHDLPLLTLNKKHFTPLKGLKLA
ncbi:MAG: type II toxin-antitoxin system VapC family toxin [Flavobacteriales bacterium]|nr:type II toxin-antitoxin system VapC family toxin [Flavobacteriales bacterium]